MDNLSLAARLREDTRDAHRSVEATPFVRQLFAGRISREHYQRYLRQLHAVYSALEEAGAGAERVAHFFDPDLARAEPLARDLDWWSGNAGWRAEPVEAATSAYVDRIRAVVRDEPDRLIAHHYVRYLGDLSGGQAIKRVVCRAFALKGDTGTDFYRFPGIADPEEYKTRYRSQLDDLSLDPAAINLVVAEAQHAFDLNRQVFEALATV